MEELLMFLVQGRAKNGKLWQDDSSWCGFDHHYSTSHSNGACCHVIPDRSPSPEFNLITRQTRSNT
ncbi:predicted protein [Botrytis cinerea T4]|uniref:Uncharacterized protein n=1 Tax=Botryotinia fuckeliana (strain T4) TaxID=999810 RepID=G2YIA9_BOTF4|nr:predicted protein [Botrytis cinerea T4]